MAVTVSHLPIQLWEEFKESLLGGLKSLRKRSPTLGKWFLRSFGLRDGYDEDQLVITLDTVKSSFRKMPDFWLHILFHRRELVVEWRSQLFLTESPEFGKWNTSRIVAVDRGRVVRFQVETTAGAELLDARGLCVHILMQIVEIQGLPAFDPEEIRLMLAHAAPAELSRPRRQGKSKRLYPDLERVKRQIRQMRDAGYNQIEICKRLGSAPRPKNAAWSDLTFLAAFMDTRYRGSVKSWLSRV